MKIELVSREIIKPSSPTPHHLKTYTLSFIDNRFVCNIPLIFFYNPKEVSDDQTSKISQLKKSLSLILNKYYIFAGRLKNKDTIECNDQGVSFLVMNIKNKQLDIIQNPTEKLLNLLFPDELQWKDVDPNLPLIAIQINCFACGGMAISICMSHKCGDVATFINFMNEWSIINKKLQEEEDKGLLILPFPLHEGGSSIFPHENLPFCQVVHNRQNNVACKRFVFQPSMIKFLKEIATSSSSMYSASRVLVVIAWIYKHLVSSMGLNSKTMPLVMAVDLRKRMVPPLSEKCVGNFIWFYFIVADKEEMKLKDLVFKLKEGLNEFCQHFPKLFGGNNSSLIAKYLNKLMDPNSKKKNVIQFTSWCNFPIYEVDFGWGKPSWVTTSGCSWKNFIVLMDTRDGNGIEVVVNLEENDMAKFEHEVEVFQHSFLNPCNVHQSIEC